VQVLLAVHEFMVLAAPPLSQSSYWLHVFVTQELIVPQVLLVLQVSVAQEFVMLHAFTSHMSLPDTHELYAPLQPASARGAARRPPRRIPPPSTDFAALWRKSRRVTAAPEGPNPPTSEFFSFFMSCSLSFLRRCRAAASMPMRQARCLSPGPPFRCSHTFYHGMLGL
jgi:hypothetical protein